MVEVDIYFSEVPTQPSRQPRPPPPPSCLAALMTLQFGAPNSPLCQPRNVVLGNTLAAGIAVTFSYVPCLGLGLGLGFAPPSQRAVPPCAVPCCATPRCAVSRAVQT